MENQSPKKILLASPFFYPEMISTGKYNTFLFKKLLDANCAVTVVCSYPFYPAWQPEFTTKNLTGAEILRGGLNISYPKQTIARRLVLESWFSRHFFSTTKNLKETEVVIAIMPPVSFAFWIKYFFKKAKKIAIVHDLMGIMANSHKNSVRTFVAAIIKKIESFILRRFDKVICLSESMKTTVVNEYKLKEDRCEVHYPFVTIKEIIEGPCVWNDLFPKGYIHLVYAGALGEKHNPEELYRFLEIVADHRQQIMCHVFSRGPIFDKLNKKNRQKRILFHDLVPEDLLPKLYACSDIQIIPQAEGTSTGAFPSKIPNIIASGVPILAICDPGSELEIIIRESGTGLVVSGWETLKLLSALDDLLADISKESRSDRITRTQQYVNNKFSVDRLVDSLTH